MRYYKRIACAFGLLTLVLNGCSSLQSGSTPQAAKSVARPAGDALRILTPRDSFAKSRRADGNSWLDKETFKRQISTPGAHYIVYASNFYNSTVDLYQYNTYPTVHAGQTPFGSISVNSPAGLAVDAAQDLFVVDSTDFTVNEYTAGSMPQASLSFNTAPYPQGVAVGPDGTVYVATDGYEGPGANLVPGCIQAFKKGATTPFETITSSAMYNAYYVAVDKSSNVYVSYGPESQSADYIGEIKAGTTKLVPLGLADNAYGVRLDGSGNILTFDYVTGNIDVYNNGTTSPASGSSFPVASAGNNSAFFDLTYARNEVFATNFNSSGLPIFNYPGGAAQPTINPNGPQYLYGVVIAPAAPYPPAFVP